MSTGRSGAAIAAGTATVYVGTGLFHASAETLILVNTVLLTILLYFFFKENVKFPEKFVSWETVYISFTGWIMLATIMSLLLLIIGKIKHDTKYENVSSKIIRWGTLPIYILALVLFGIAMVIGLA
jgi:hypothetical protein